MAAKSSNTPSWNETAVHTVAQAIGRHDEALRALNKKIHSNPELAYEEYIAHDVITTFLQDLGFQVTKHAYGLPTAFMAEYGSKGRIVAFNAEYDALPEIGHACGHNLIATSSLASFLAASALLEASKLPGRLRLIGTPAEEKGGGKIRLIDADAYKDVDACLMVHPAAHGRFPKGVTGIAYAMSSANVRYKARFTGKPAHAATAPWQGINALDAVCLAYNGISMLRQQIQPHERISALISDGGKTLNVIPKTGAVEFSCRAKTLKEAEFLKNRVINCLNGAASATCCSVECTSNGVPYADLRPNKSICSAYGAAMEVLKTPVYCGYDSRAPGSTDMGNVTYVCPGFHGGFAVPSDLDAFNHTAGFTKAAGTNEAYELAINTAKGMALVGWKILADDSLAKQIRAEFDQDVKSREEP